MQPLLQDLRYALRQLRKSPEIIRSAGTIYDFPDFKSIEHSVVDVPVSTLPWLRQEMLTSRWLWMVTTLLLDCGRIACCPALSGIAHAILHP